MSVISQTQCIIIQDCGPYLQMYWKRSMKHSLTYTWYLVRAFFSVISQTQYIIIYQSFTSSLIDPFQSTARYIYLLGGNFILFLTYYSSECLSSYLSIRYFTNPTIDIRRKFFLRCNAFVVIVLLCFQTSLPSSSSVPIKDWT